MDIIRDPSHRKKVTFNINRKIEQSQGSLAACGGPASYYTLDNPILVQRKGSSEEGTVQYVDPITGTVQVTYHKKIEDKWEQESQWVSVNNVNPKLELVPEGFPEKSDDAIQDRTNSLTTDVLKRLRSLVTTVDIWVGKEEKNEDPKSNDVVPKVRWAKAAETKVSFYSDSQRTVVVGEVSKVSSDFKRVYIEYFDNEGRKSLWKSAKEINPPIAFVFNRNDLQE